MLYDFDNIDYLNNIEQLKIFSLIPDRSLIRLSKSGTGIHVRTRDFIPYLFKLSCQGFQEWVRRGKKLLWESPYRWITVTEALKTELLSSRNPTVVLQRLS